VEYPAAGCRTAKCGTVGVDEELFLRLIVGHIKNKSLSVR